MNTYIRIGIIALFSLAVGVGVVSAGAYNSPVFTKSTLFWADSYSSWGGDKVGKTQTWSARTDMDKVPGYSNVVIKTVQPKRLNFTHEVMDSMGENDVQFAQVWFSRKLTDPTKPGYTFYPSLAERILNNYDLVWRDAPPSTTPMFVTPYYNNKWVLHYSFVRDKDGKSALELPQGVDDYTVEQVGLAY